VADAEDIAQEALLRAWRAQGQLRDGESFSGWLAAIVRNEAMRSLTRSLPEPMPFDEYEPAADDESLAQLLEREEIASIFGLLSEHERRLLRLRYDDDMTQPAIAEKLGLPEGTVKVQLHRARAKLRKALEA
jgi:RNA polymerase sigma-70 factor (ECF subfamily)